MTTEIEKTFFDTFRIRAYYKYLLIDKTSRYHNEKLLDKTNFIDFVKSGKDYLLLKVIKHYPKITDRILLELICAYNNFQNDTDSFFIPCDFINIENNILTILVEEINETYKNRYFGNDVNKLKHQVRTLFEED